MNTYRVFYYWQLNINDNLDYTSLSGVLVKQYGRELSQTLYYVVPFLLI